MNGKGRPPKLTDDLKQWITTRQKGLKKKLKAPALQEEIKLNLEKQERKDASEKGWTEKLIQGQVEAKLPGVSSIQKYLNETDSDKNLPLDTQWHLGALKQNPLPAEAINYILKVNKWVTSKQFQPVTIRQANWIAQLYGVIENNKEWRKPLEEALWIVSLTYASYEMICDLSNTNPDTRDIDEVLLQGNRQFILRVRDNPIIEKAIEAAFYQLGGLGPAKEHVNFIDKMEKEGEK